MRTQHAVLMHRAKRAQRHIVLDDYVAGERGGVRQNAAAAYMAVVAHVRVGHQQVAGTEPRYAAAARVPRLMVTHSRMVLPSPITVSVGSPAYFRSCGATPMEQNG